MKATFNIPSKIYPYISDTQRFCRICNLGCFMTNIKNIYVNGKRLTSDDFVITREYSGFDEDYVFTSSKIHYPTNKPMEQFVIEFDKQYKKKVIKEIITMKLKRNIKF